MQTWRLTGPQSRALRERVWRLVDEIEIVSREEPEPVEPVDEEQVAALAALADTLELALLELAESSDRLREMAGRLYGVA